MHSLLLVPTSSDNVVTVGCHFKEGQSFMVVLEQTVGFPLNMVPVYSFGDLAHKLYATINYLPDVVHGVLLYGPRSTEICDDLTEREAFRKMTILVRLLAFF